MRDMGLRTFIDAWMRHPRPEKVLTGTIKRTRHFLT